MDQKSSSVKSAAATTFVVLDVEMSDPQVGQVLAFGACVVRHEPMKPVQVLAACQIVLSHDPDVQNWVGASEESIRWWMAHKTALKALAADKEHTYDQEELAVATLHDFLAHAAKAYPDAVLFVNDMHVDCHVTNQYLLAYKFPPLQTHPLTGARRAVYVSLDFMRGQLHMLLGPRAPHIAERGMYRCLSQEHAHVRALVPALAKVRKGECGSARDAFVVHNLKRHGIPAGEPHTPAYDAVQEALRLCDLEDIRLTCQDASRLAMRVDTSSACILQHQGRIRSIAFSVQDVLPVLQALFGVTGECRLACDGRIVDGKEPISVLYRSVANELLEVKRNRCYCGHEIPANKRVCSLGQLCPKHNVAWTTNSAALASIPRICLSCHALGHLQDVCPVAWKLVVK